LNGNKFRFNIVLVPLKKKSVPAGFYRIEALLDIIFDEVVVLQKQELLGGRLKKQGGRTIQLNFGS
jgi:hypothetical protein